MKHIIFVSDLHIGDGSSRDDFDSDKTLINLLNEWSRLESPELVIVGDGLELTENEYVKNFGLVTFWELVEKMDGRVIENIESNHKEVFEAFRSFPGTIWYVLGNHDYYLAVNEKLRKTLQEKIPNLKIVSFYYDEKSKILAVHGNQFDAVNKFTEIDGEIIPPLGDLISRYTMIELDERLKRILPEEVAFDYDNIRPVLDVFLWLEKVGNKYSQGIDIVELWIRNFISVMRQEEAKKWMRKNYPSLSKLSIVFLNEIGGIKLGEFIVRLVMKVRQIKRDDYLKRTARRILADPRYLFGRMDGYQEFFPMKPSNINEISGLVMGHRHHTSFEFLRVGHEKKFYINCGSWSPVVERNKYNIFQKYYEIFYAIAKVANDDLQIHTYVENNWLSKRSWEKVFV